MNWKSEEMIRYNMYLLSDRLGMQRAKEISPKTGYEQTLINNLEILKHNWSFRLKMHNFIWC